jgi:hypothetical protein
MSFADAVDRIQTDFIEMPGLELTLPQAVRLWSLGADDCRCVIDALVDAGFLTWTPRRTITRIDRAGRGAEARYSHVPVSRKRNNDRNVGLG